MSRYKGNGEKCPGCDLTYGKMRTGFTYRAIYQMLVDYSPDPIDWKYKRPGTILGMWHQTKKELWVQHLEGCRPKRKRKKRRKNIKKKDK